jgi:hypothetical protein
VPCDHILLYRKVLDANVFELYNGTFSVILQSEEALGSRIFFIEVRQFREDYPVDDLDERVASRDHR